MFQNGTNRENMENAFVEESNKVLKDPIYSTHTIFLHLEPCISTKPPKATYQYRIKLQFNLLK